MRIMAGESDQLCIATRCRSIDDFVGTFRRYTDDRSIFVSTLVERAPGTATAFVILLANGTPVLRGACVVREVFKTTRNAFGVPGIRLEIQQLSPRSLRVFHNLKKARCDSTLPSLSPPPPARTAVTQQYFTPIARMPSVAAAEATAEVVEDEESRASFSAPTRVLAPAFGPCGPGADAILPANPFGKLTDEWLVGYVECTLYEDTDRAAPPPEAPVGRTPKRPSRRAAILALGFTGAGVYAATLDSDTFRRDRATSPIAADLAREPRPPVPVHDENCRFVLSVTPPDAQVAVDGVLDVAPFALAAPCGLHHLDISHPQYVTTSAWVNFGPDHPEVLDVQLARPIHSVSVATMPAGASILLDGKPAGESPRTLAVPGYVPMTVVLTKPGYRTVTRHFASTAPRDRLVVGLPPARPLPVAAGTRR